MKQQAKASTSTDIGRNFIARPLRQAVTDFAAKKFASSTRICPYEFEIGLYPGWSEK
jgi:hypothetical protein